VEALFQRLNHLKKNYFKRVLKRDAKKASKVDNTSKRNRVKVTVSILDKIFKYSNPSNTYGNRIETNN
jgi:hypothetical protein